MTKREGRQLAKANDAWSGRWTIAVIYRRPKNSCRRYLDRFQDLARGTRERRRLRGRDENFNLIADAISWRQGVTNAVNGADRCDQGEQTENAAQNPAPDLQSRVTPGQVERVSSQQRYNHHSRGLRTQQP